MQSRILPALALTISILATASWCFAADDSLAAGFANPPVSAQPQTWWHWMNGNITRQGITADLESMHRVGISEANIITVASDIPPGPVPVMSPQFFDMVEFAAKEADRLGMTLCMDNCPGWSSSGGPWVKPEYAMQFVTTSQTQITGPAAFSGKLRQPPMKNGFYRDIAVLAFKATAGEANLLKPRKIEPAPLMEPGRSLVVSLSRGAAPFTIQIEYAKPVSVRTLVISAAANRAVGGDVLGSDDGVTFHTVCPLIVPRNAIAPTAISLGDKPVSARVFRLVFSKPAAGTATSMEVREARFTTGLMIANYSVKASFEPDEVDPRTVERDEQIKAGADQVVHRDQIVDLTSAMKPDGSLNWDVPPGQWTILRVGYTPTGKTNHPAPPEATGLECDKLSTTGLDESWNGMMQPILDRLGPLGGKVLVDCLIDSYETGGQNWTANMAAEFKARRGYDPTPFLPVMTGRVVDSPEVSERFLWDMRRTVADLFAEKYYGHFTELCHQHGLKSMIEPYTGPFESLQCGGPDDIPMAEFWAGSNGHASVKMASSVGHIYGQPIIAAESFTGRPDHGMWTDDPFSFKALGDQMFCQGINRFVFHRFAHQPWMDKYPGMTMGQWGINLDRTNTWFEWSGPWMKYITRSQFLLQQGRSVADVAYFCGQSAPVVARQGTPALPKGFDYDDINADVLMSRATVVDHRIVLATGASYAVLVLPESDPEMTPELLAKLRDLVNGGATIVGPRPDHSPSLQNYPACDGDVQKIAAEMWGDCDGKSVTEHALGQGKVIWGQSLDQVLARLHLQPDFQTPDAAPGARFEYIHRTLADADVFFVADHGDAVHQNCTFRVSGKLPELWHPDTGVMAPAPAYQVSGGRVTVSLDFDPSGSVFVVFRQPDSPADHTVTASRQLIHGGDAIPVDGTWQLSFPPNWGAPVSVTLDRLISWPDSPDKGVRYFSGTATYAREIDIPADLLSGGPLLLQLGEVKNLARVKLNGTDLGILWKPPFTVDIAPAARAGTNHLEIQITNLWPNRLIGDAQLPEDVEWKGMKLAGWPQWLLDGKPSPTGRLTFTTWRHITKDMPLLPSGLIGPVTLQAEKWVAGQ